MICEVIEGAEQAPDLPTFGACFRWSVCRGIWWSICRGIWWSVCRGKRWSHYAEFHPSVTMTYNADGMMTQRNIDDRLLPAPSHAPREDLTWGYNKRLLYLTTSAIPGITPAVNWWENDVPIGCQVNPAEPPETYLDGALEWAYRYSHTGLREQRRLMRAPNHDSSTCSGVMPWTYYVRGVDGRELTVYSGRQLKRATSNGQCNVGNGAIRQVYIYPVEHRAYGPHGVDIIWQRDANGVMQKYFASLDVRGSIWALHDANDNISTYHPFGYPIDVVGGYDNTFVTRTSFLDREKDVESAPGNPEHSMLDVNARKYVPSNGLFASPDELWAIDASVSSYGYAAHDPVNLIDPSGYVILPPSMSTPTLYGNSGADMGGGGYFAEDVYMIPIFLEDATLGYDVYRRVSFGRFVHYSSNGIGGAGGSPPGSNNGQSSGNSPGAMPFNDLLPGSDPVVVPPLRSSPPASRSDEFASLISFTPFMGIYFEALYYVQSSNGILKYLPKNTIIPSFLPAALGDFGGLMLLGSGWYVWGTHEAGQVSSGDLSPGRHTFHAIQLSVSSIATLVSLAGYKPAAVYGFGLNALLVGAEYTYFDLLPYVDGKLDELSWHIGSIESGLRGWKP